MADFSVDLRDLLEAGAHFGHQARRWNPKMQRFIYAERDGVHIFDLAVTAKQLAEAMQAIHDLVANGKEVVFIGTKRQAKAIVKEEALKVGAPYVTERWLGGMFTNWEQMEQRLKRLKSLKERKEKGELAQYTKKEQVLFDREIARLERFFGGLATLNKLPEAVFVVDSHREVTAVLEAKKVGLKIFAMVDSNGDPSVIDCPIPVNDDAVRSIKLIVEKIGEAYAEGKRVREKAKKS